MLKFKNILYLLPVFLFLLISPFIINAATSESGKDVFEKEGTGRSDIFTKSQGESFSLPNPLGEGTDITELFARISGWLLGLGTAMFTLMILWGAFQILTAAGNEEQISKGRHTITWTIIGYILLLIATGINLIIKNVLSGK